MLLSEAMEGFALELRAAGRSPTTLHFYGYRIVRIVESMGDLEITAVTPQQIRQWLATRDMSPGTLHGYYRTLRALFNWLEREGLVTQNPIRRVKAPTWSCTENVVQRK